MNSAKPPAIVITGAGLVTGLGLNKSVTWRRVVAGESGIRALTSLEQEPKPNEGGAEAPLLVESDSETESREVTILRLAISEAIAEANLERHWPVPERCGVMLGTTLAGMRSGGRFLRTNSVKPMRGFLASSTLQSALRDVPCGGPAMTTSSACASGLSSIALATTLLQNGVVDLMIAGGYDPISEYAYAGFNSLRLVSDDAIMPFSGNRSGMKLGEGAGIVILERAIDAQRRGADVLTTIAGVGESSDAHHLTHPHPEGDGAARAMQTALAAAGLTPADIDMISAHATATPANDAAEYQAYLRVFGDQLKNIPIVAFKSHVGHTLGGAGAVELVLSLMAKQHGLVPPTANTSVDSGEFPALNIRTGAALKHKVQYSLNVSMGFGGANACVILGPPPRFSNDTPLPAQRNANGKRALPQKVMITGIGVLLPNCIGNDAFIEKLKDVNALSVRADLGPIDESLYEHLVNARRARRISTFAKMMLAATTIACRDADLEGLLTGAVPCSAILGTTHGAAEYSEKYYRQIVDEGIDAANPMLFAEGVPNVGSAQVSLMLNLRGGSQTIVGSRTAGLDALILASERIRAGDWDRAIVGAAEEFSETVNGIYRRCGAMVEGAGAGSNGVNQFHVGCGSVVIVLESERAASSRNARVLASIESGGSLRCISNERGRIASEDVANVIKRLFRDIPVKGSLFRSSRGSVLDAIERSAIQNLIDENVLNGPVRDINEHIGETFSVGPLAAVAAMSLTPRDAGSKKAVLDEGVFIAPGSLSTSLALDPSGVASAVTLRM